MAYIFERERLVKLETIIKSEYLPAMNLSNWNIYVCLDRPKNQDAQLETEVVPCRYVANVFIGHMFENLPLIERHNAIIHELLHLPQDRMRVQINSMNAHSQYSLSQAISDVLTNEIEYNTDWLAGVLSRFIPIPERLKEW